MLSLMSAQKKIDERHRNSCLAGTCGHDQKRSPFTLRKGFTDTTDGFVLIRSIYDAGIDRLRFQRLAVLASESKPPQIIGREYTGNEPRVADPDLPEICVDTIREESEGNKCLAFGDFSDVLAKLLLTLAWAPAGALRLNDG